MSGTKNPLDDWFSGSQREVQKVLCFEYQHTQYSFDMAHREVPQFFVCSLSADTQYRAERKWVFPHIFSHPQPLQCFYLHGLSKSDDMTGGNVVGAQCGEHKMLETTGSALFSNLHQVKCSPLPPSSIKCLCSRSLITTLPYSFLQSFLVPSNNSQTIF